MKSLLTAAAFAVVAGSASAATTTYDYTGSNTNASGPALSCTAFGILNSGCAVTYNPAGLGVNGSPDTQPDQIDGNPVLSGETLTFNFGYDVTWNNLTFGRWDSDDDATLTTAMGSSTWGPNASSSVNLNNVISKYLTVAAYGQFWSDGIIIGNDSFTVSSITVSSVPVPAAGLMLMFGLGGIAAIRRRRKAA